MTLELSHNKLNDLASPRDNMSPWEKKGIDEDDYLMAEECGLISQRKQVGDEFEEMIENEEDFQEELNKFLNENKRAEKNDLFEQEVIFKDQVYMGVDVRLVYKNKNYGIGSIDGVKNVFVPKSIVSNISIGEIVKMNLIYKPTEKNLWKAIYVHSKIDPYVKASFTNSDDITLNVLEVPKQDLGKMIGKNGFNINKIRNDIIHNIPELSNFWYKNDTELHPSVDVENCNDCTTINLWERCDTGYDSIEGFVKKMYC